ncbi:hypothetical protein AK830_g6749 [Neonectria ditissima]|uniref:Insecticide toxin TcdB middle/N-terminal domain-containing protein n=1 Tax=Neonectria ditissima TaxID=78410 RepID=A0A0P7B1A1_9HYPO|nr:hypothetical protein AK830_g6749 [Neonectria ditissima]
MTDSLPLGHIECFSIVDRTFNLVVRKEDCDVSYGSSGEKLMGQSLSSLMVVGGHVDLDGDETWWAPSNRLSFLHPQESKSELTCARQSFFTPRAAVDPFGNASHVEMDHHLFLAVQATDALGNTTSAINDYRSMKPRESTDSNDNQTVSAMDVWGETLAVARMGKEAEDVGDSPDSDVSLVGSDVVVRDFLDTPRKSTARTLLGGWGSRTFHCRQMSRVQERTLPPFKLEMRRSQHAFCQGAPNADTGDISVEVTYLDSSGEILQRSFITSWDDDRPDTWTVKDCTVHDADDQVVKTHQAFFASHGLYFPPNEIDSPSSISFIDAFGRNVGLLKPDHSWTKTKLSAWSQSEINEGSTINMEDPREDPDLGFYFHALTSTSFLPTWLQNQNSIGTIQDRIAAEKSMIYAGTSRDSYLNSSGKTIVQVDGAGSPMSRIQMFDFDFNGNLVAATDSLGRVVEMSHYDMPGRRMCISSIDAGEKKTVYDCAGNPVLTCTSQGVSTRTVYDSLRRPTELRIMNEDGDKSREVLWCKTSYGESEEAPEVRNMRGRVSRVLDQSGENSVDSYDFKGHATGETSRPAIEYKSTLDWTRENTLEEKCFHSSTKYDALECNVLSTDALGRQTRRAFDLGGQILRIESKAVGGAWVTHLMSAKYSSDGLPERIQYGNKSTTQYTAQPVEYFRNSTARPAREYWYDTLGRLIRASGREMVSAEDNSCVTNHSGKKRFTPADHRLVNCVESYSYDAADNIKEIHHQLQDKSIPSWSRKYFYEEDIQIQAGKKGNRLSRIVNGCIVDNYGYSGSAGQIGCMTSMPGYSRLEWDSSGKLKSISRQQVSGSDAIPEKTWYVYNRDGVRTRKVTERLGRQSKLKQTLFLQSAEIYTKTGGEKPPLVRYNLSSNLEVDDESRLISYEEYTPFGASVLTSRRSDVEAAAKYRFASYRRDAETGLYACDTEGTSRKDNQKKQTETKTSKEDKKTESKDGKLGCGRRFANEVNSAGWKLTLFLATVQTAAEVSTAAAANYAISLFPTTVKVFLSSWGSYAEQSFVNAVLLTGSAKLWDYVTGNKSDFQKLSDRLDDERGARVAMMTELKGALTRIDALERENAALRNQQTDVVAAIATTGIVTPARPPQKKPIFKKAPISGT